MKKNQLVLLFLLMLTSGAFAQSGVQNWSALVPGAPTYYPPNYYFNTNSGTASHTVGLGTQDVIRQYGWGTYPVLLGGSVMHAGAKFESYGVNANNTLNNNSRFIIQHGTNHTTIGTGKLQFWSTVVSIGQLYGGTDYLFTVDGKIRARELRLDTDVWPDYVFSDSYKLKSLYEVETYINENNHLPDVPAACEVEGDGLDISEMVKIQMQKIEELTLHMISLKKDNDAMKAEIANLKK